MVRIDNEGIPRETVWMRSIAYHTWHGEPQPPGSVYLAQDERVDLIETIENLKFGVRDTPPPVAVRPAPVVAPVPAAPVQDPAPAVETHTAAEESAASAPSARGRRSRP